MATTQLRVRRILTLKTGRVILDTDRGFVHIQRLPSISGSACHVSKELSYIIPEDQVNELPAEYLRDEIAQSKSAPFSGGVAF